MRGDRGRRGRILRRALGAGWPALSAGWRALGAGWPALSAGWLALGAGWLALACAPAPEAQRPHVLLISVDTLNREALAAFDPGAPALPAFDSVAARARRFHAAYTPSSWTLPAHASLLSGWLPDRHGAVHPLRLVSDTAPALAARLGDAGYQTIALTEAGFLAGQRGLARGFERYDETVATDAPAGPVLPRGGLHDPSPDPAVFDRAIALLRGRRDPRPLFLFLHTYLVHDYWKAPEWATADLPPFDADATNLDRLTGNVADDAAHWTHLRGLYALHVRRMDEHLDALLRALESSGLADETLLILVSDHGEGLSPETGYRHHGGHLLPGRLGVPLLVAGPGVEPGDSHEPVSLVDVPPTLIEWLGLEAETDSDGHSFAAALRGGELPAQRDLFAMEYSFAWRQGRRHLELQMPQRPLGLALLRGDHWYLRAGDSTRLYSLAGGAFRDLEDDTAAARALLAAGDARGRSLPAAADHTPSAEDLERLRALGYALDEPGSADEP